MTRARDVDPDLVRAQMELRDSVLFWKARPRSMFSWDRGWRNANSRCAGKPVNLHRHDGYECFWWTAGRRQRAHRIIWLLTYGEYPSADIDHINGDRADNRLCNLRDVSRAVNARNSAMRTGTRSGINGVCAQGKRWCAYIRIDGHRTRLGVFDRKEDAAAARRKAEVESNAFSPRHGRAA